MIGDNIVVGVGLVVIKDLLVNVVVYGLLVKVICEINEYDCQYIIIRVERLFCYILISFINEFCNQGLFFGGCYL